MKKICFIVERYDPIVGGTERLCQQILETLLPTEEYKISVITQPVENRNKFSYKYKIYDAPFQQFHLMKEHFEIFKYDLTIFFADLHSPYLNIYDYTWSKKNICILNLDENTYNWKDNFKKATENLKKFDNVVTFTKDGVANKFLKENNIKNIYIPNFSRDVLESNINFDFISKLSLNKNKKTILYNAAYEDRKNQLTVLEHIKKSNILKNYNWIFIGNPSDEKYLQKCIHFSNLNKLDCVKFLKATNDQEKLDKLYQTSDCLLLASKAEGLPLVILEAMSANKGVVTTPVGGVKGVLGHTGISILSSISFDTLELESEIKKQIENKNSYRDLWYTSFRKQEVCQKYKNIIKESL